MTEKEKQAKILELKAQCDRLYAQKAAIGQERERLKNELRALKAAPTEPEPTPPAAA